MAHEAHPSLAALQAKQRVSTFKPPVTKPQKRIPTKSVMNLEDNKVVTGHVKYFKQKIQTNEANDSKQPETSKTQTNAKTANNKANPNKNGNGNEKDGYYCDYVFSVDFNSPSMINLCDEIEEMMTNSEKHVQTKDNDEDKKVNE